MCRLPRQEPENSVAEAAADDREVCSLEVETRKPGLSRRTVPSDTHAPAAARAHSVLTNVSSAAGREASASAIRSDGTSGADLATQGRRTANTKPNRRFMLSVLF